MNFLSNLVNQVPVVGLAKGVIHDLAGDKTGAKDAYRQCTRATAVLAGGITGGPLGAIGAGAAVDVLLTLESDEAQGIVRGLKNVADDIDDGKIPIRSTIETVLTPACDAIGGQAAGNVYKSLAKSAGKKILIQETTEIGKNVALATVPVICEGTLDATNKIGRSVVRSSTGGGGGGGGGGGRSNSKPSSSGQSSTNKPSTGSTSSGSSSGGPPKRNPNLPSHTTTQTKTNTKTLVEQILKLLEKYFPKMSTNEANRLRLLINSILDNGYDMRILVIALSMFNRLKIKDDDVMVFASLAEFLMVFIQEQMFVLMDSDLANAERSFEELFEIVLKNIMNSTYISDTVLNTFKNFFNIIKVKYKYGEGATFDDMMDLVKDLAKQLKSVSGRSRFRDIYSALYHFYKHRRVISKNGGLVILTLDQYFDLIELIYNEIQDTSRYRQMKRTQNGEEPDPNLRVYDYTYISAHERYGRRFKLVLKLQNGRIVVASCHWLDFSKK